MQSYEIQDGKMVKTEKRAWYHFTEVEAEREKYREVLLLMQRVCEEALPKFNWGASAKDRSFKARYQAFIDELKQLCAKHAVVIGLDWENGFIEIWDNADGEALNEEAIIEMAEVRRSAPTGVVEG